MGFGWKFSRHHQENKLLFIGFRFITVFVCRLLIRSSLSTVSIIYSFIWKVLLVITTVHITLHCLMEALFYAIWVMATWTLLIYTDWLLLLIGRNWKWFGTVIRTTVKRINFYDALKQIKARHATEAKNATQQILAAWLSDLIWLCWWNRTESKQTIPCTYMNECSWLCFTSTSSCNRI